MTLKIGDIVKPNSSGDYNYDITNTRNKWEGRIIKINGEEFNAVTTKCSNKYCLNHIFYDLKLTYFDVVFKGWKERYEQ